MKTRPLFALLITHTLLVSVLGQQVVSPQSKPRNQDDVVQITTNLVQMDVAVTDKKGRSVTDLTAADFEIYEDGHQQKITNFSFVSGPVPSQLTAAEKHRVSGDLKPLPLPTVNLRPEQVHRTVALVVDDLGLSFESMFFVRNALRKFVDEQMQSGDLVAIVRTGAGVGALQQFTADKRLLYAAIDRVKWNSRGRAGISAFAAIEDSPLDAFNKRPRGDMSPAPINEGMKKDPEKDARNRYNDFKDDVFSVGTLGALNYIVRGLRTLPGRKSVVLLSDTLALFDSSGEGNLRTIQALRRLTDLANRASVVIYTLDPRGLPPLNLAAADNTSGPVTLENGKVVRGNSGAALMQSLNQRTLGAWKTQEGLKYLALETGGFYITNNNDVNLGIKQALDASKDYYLIGYRPEESTFDPKTGQRRFHEVSIKVKRPGLVVRTRTGFFGITNDEAQPVRHTVGEELMAAINTPFASDQIDLRLTSVFLDEPEYGSFVRSLIFVNGTSLSFQKQTDGTYRAAVDVLAMTFDDTGTSVDRRSRTQEIIIPAAEYESVLNRGVTFGINLPVKIAGAFQLRIAVRDAGSGRVGSANQYIEIPDLKKGRLALSGIYLAEHDEASSLLSTTTAGGVKPTDQASEGRISERDPGAGPAVRRFRKGATVDYGFEVYNAHLDKGTRLSQLQSQVRLFRDNEIVFSGKILNLTGQPDSKRLVAVGRLPLAASLPEGDYVLQVLVTDPLAKDKNRIATQWIEFEIR